MALFDIIGDLLDPAEKKEAGWIHSSASYHSNTLLSKDAAWWLLFNENHKAFQERETWKFRYIARTNGKDLVVHLKCLILSNTPYYIRGHAIDLMFDKSGVKEVLTSEIPSEPYIDQIRSDELAKRVVAIDPG